MKIEKIDVVIIFYCLINHLENWELDLYKFVVFITDGPNTKVCFYGGIATRLKKNHSFLSYYCIAHRINLTALDASKAP